MKAAEKQPTHQGGGRWASAVKGLDCAEDIHVDDEGSYHIQVILADNSRIGFIMSAHWYTIKGGAEINLEHCEIYEPRAIDKLMEVIRDWKEGQGES